MLSSEELEGAKRAEAWAKATGGRPGGFAPRRVGSDVGVSVLPGPGAVKGPRGASIVTVIQTARPFLDILKETADENVRLMYDDLMKEVGRRGMKL